MSLDPEKGDAYPKSSLQTRKVYANDPHWLMKTKRLFGDVLSQHAYGEAIDWICGSAEEARAGVFDPTVQCMEALQRSLLAGKANTLDAHHWCWISLPAGRAGPRC